MSIPSCTLLTLPTTASHAAKHGAARRAFVAVLLRPGSGVRGETTLHWEFVDSHHFKHDPVHLVSFEELGFDDGFAELFVREYEKTASSTLAGLERVLGARIYRHALIANRPNKVSGQE